VDGYNDEDAEFFRIYYDGSSSSSSKSSSTKKQEEAKQPNYLGQNLMYISPSDINYNNAEDDDGFFPHQGTLIIAKIKRFHATNSTSLIENNQEGPMLEKREELVPFVMSEIIDLLVWRRFVGTLRGNLSSRMYRENMRRKELAAHILSAKQGELNVTL
jgi:hypothetical protein